MSRLNVENRTLAIMDNLTFLQTLNNECIDLIAIDPPFAANETFTGHPRPPITDAEMAEERALAEQHGVSYNEGVGETRVRDVWSWDENVHPDWKASIEDDYPAIFSVLEAVEASASENEAAYIAYMAARLIQCHRVLKPTGSIYVHCDDHANSYLRILLDAIFGSRNFRNVVVWKRTSRGFKGSQFSPRNYNSNTDTILFYGKTAQAPFAMERVLEPYDTDYLDNAFKLNDDTGPYYLDVAYNRPSANPRPNLCYEYKGFFPPHPSGWKVGEERMKELDADGELVVRDGVLYRKVRPRSGRIRNTLWDDVRAAQGGEMTGYATQKPLALYERIIAASSNPGDVVLDVFAGCATTAVAAERLDRQWIACDMAYRSWTMLKRRFYLNGYALDDMTDSTHQALGVSRQTELQSAKSYTLGPHDLPGRDDFDPAPHHALAPTRGRLGRSSTQTASWSGRIPKDEAKKLLIDRFGPECWGCGYKPLRPNGSLDDTLLEVDHIRARRPAAGISPGNDEIYNLALLHRTCNGIKRNNLTLEQLREYNALNGLLYVNGPGDLVDLYEATRFASEQIAIRAASYGVQESLAP